MYLSNTKTLILAGILRERTIHSSHSRRIEGKKSTLFCMNTVMDITNYFLNVFYTASVSSSWVLMMAQNPAILMCFSLCLDTRWPQWTIDTERCPMISLAAVESLSGTVQVYMFSIIFRLPGEIWFSIILKLDSPSCWVRDNSSRKHQHVPKICGVIWVTWA